MHMGQTDEQLEEEEWPDEATYQPCTKGQLGRHHWRYVCDTPLHTFRFRYVCTHCKRVVNMPIGKRPRE